jgi:hypothetical protein
MDISSDDGVVLDYRHPKSWLAATRPSAWTAIGGLPLPALPRMTASRARYMAAQSSMGSLRSQYWHSLYASSAQPILWGTQRTTSTVRRLYHIQWDDDNPTDGDHDPAAECYDYTFGVCPDPACWAA